MTNTRQDEKIILLIDEFGMEGYGVYWAILESIATQISAGNNQYSIQLSVKSWRKITELSPKKLQNFLLFASKISLFSVENIGEKIKVSCPNLLKYRDEYTRKSGQPPDKLPNKNGPKSGATPTEETETETDKEKDADSADAARIFSMGVSLLTSTGTREPSARSFLGKYAKQDSGKLAEIIAYLTVNKKIEPKAYIVEAMKPKQRKAAI